MASNPFAEVRTPLPSGPLHKQTLKASTRHKVTHEPDAVQIAQEMTPHQLASVLFDMAAIRFGTKNEALAITISQATGFTVSASLVGRWRSTEARETFSEPQLLALGTEFNRIYHQLKSDHFGWGRHAMLDVVRALGELAVAREGR